MLFLCLFLFIGYASRPSHAKKKNIKECKECGNEDKVRSFGNIEMFVDIEILVMIRWPQIDINKDSRWWSLVSAFAPFGAQ